MRFTKHHRAVPERRTLCRAVRFAPFINIKFHGSLFATAIAGNYSPDCRLNFRENGRVRT
jgi:hypothetical protein